MASWRCLLVVFVIVGAEFSQQSNGYNEFNYYRDNQVGSALQ